MDLSHYWIFVYHWYVVGNKNIISTRFSVFQMGKNPKDKVSLSSNICLDSSVGLPWEFCSIHTRDFIHKGLHATGYLAQVRRSGVPIGNPWSLHPQGFQFLWWNTQPTVICQQQARFNKFPHQCTCTLYSEYQWSCILINSYHQVEANFLHFFS